MYLDASPQHSPPHQVPYKLASRWMGPYRALEVRGPVVHLELPPELGKISPWVNVRRLKFFEQRDAEFSDFEAPVTPVQGGDGALRYEIHRTGGDGALRYEIHRGDTNLRDSCPLLNIWYSGRAMIRLR